MKGPPRWTSRDAKNGEVASITQSVVLKLSMRRHSGARSSSIGKAWVGEEMPKISPDVREYAANSSTQKVGPESADSGPRLFLLADYWQATRASALLTWMLNGPVPVSAIACDFTSVGVQVSVTPSIT